MTRSALTLEVLPAGHGDCLLVSAPVGRRTWRLLVDTGPDETYPALRERLRQLPVDARGLRHLDLFVVTHIDHDHIGGAARLLGDRELRLSFGDVWFNAPPRSAPRAVREGEELAALLGAAPAVLPWNRAFGGALAQTPGDGRSLEVPMPRGAPRITLLSPTPKRLQALFKVWHRELARLQVGPRGEASPGLPAVSPRGLDDVEALAARRTPLDRSTPNGSSIAFLLEHRGAALLCAADAFATVLGPALLELASARGTPVPLVVDVVKLSHHGSRANVTRDLFSAVRAPHYVVSTSGAIFDHPDDEAMARTLVHGGRGATVWFNHRTSRTERWADPALLARYGCTAAFPTEDTGGVTIEVPARKAAAAARTATV